MELLYGLLIIVLAATGTLYILLRRALAVNEQLEENVKVLEKESADLLDSNNQYDMWFEEFKSRLIYSYQRMKAIDASGHFEADDEVGYFFTELKTLIERLHELGIIDEFENQEIRESTKKITTESIQEVLAKRNSAVLTKKEK